MKKNGKRAVCGLLAAAMVAGGAEKACAAGAPGDITAQTWALAEADSGQILAERMGDARMYPASITKVLTIAMALEKCQNDRTVQLTVSHDAVYSIERGSSHIALQVGEVVSMDDMVHGAMLASGNDAANVLAEYVCGSLAEVENVFGQKLAEIGCTDTNFTNAHGLHDVNHYTTANDMVRILHWALTVPGFEDVFNSMKYDMQPTNLQPQIRYFSTADWLRLNGIKYHYDPAVGSKNGWTTEAGHTFVSLAEKDGRRLICVLMNCATKYTKFVDAEKLYTYGYENFGTITLTPPSREIEILGGGGALGTGTLTCAPITLTVASGVRPEDIELEITAPEKYVLGVGGQAAVTARMKSDGSMVGSWPMQLEGLETVLQASAGLVPENLFGSGRTKEGPAPGGIVLYTAVALLGVLAIAGAWKLGRRQARQLRRPTGRVRMGEPAVRPYRQPFSVVIGARNARPSHTRFTDGRGTRRR